MIQEEYVRMFNLENDYWWYKALHQITEFYIQKEYKNKGRLEIFDAGCGTGRMMQIALKYGNIAGIDYSETAIKFCKERNLSAVSQNDLNTYNFEKNKYDIIICNDVLYHSAIKNEKKILESFFDALKPDGKLIVSLAAFPILKRHHDKVVEGARRYKKNETQKMFISIGFKIEKISYRLPILFFILLLKKILEKIFIQKETESDLNKISAWLNSLLFKMSKTENKLIVKGFTMPLGSSLFIVASKK